MSTKHAQVFLDLAAVFDDREHKCLKKGGQELWYVTARSVMNRLDSVLGPENWRDHYIVGPNSVVCQLTITLPDGREVTKEDAGGFAGMKDLGDNEKSGFSDAFKRAAVKFGVGRYLYGDGVAAMAGELPSMALVNADPGDPIAGLDRLSPADFSLWCKDMNEDSGKDVLGYLRAWGIKQGYPAALKDWTDPQIRAAIVRGKAKMAEAFARETVSR